MAESLVLPALHVPADVHVSEEPRGGGRLWVDAVRRGSTLPLVPDLSRDVVMTHEGPALTARTVSFTLAPLSRRTAMTGVRLPIAATSISLDRTWPGWASRSSPEDRLADALENGAITWIEDPVVSSYVASAQADPTNVPQMARSALVSERTLRRRVKQALGVSPVYVGRVLRLHRLARLIQHHSVATAAADAGYADQSHAARDVQSLTGLRLRQFAQFRLAE